jgi:hypothetical protein
MTIQEYIDILLDNEIIIEGGSNADRPYRFTDKGMELIRRKFPSYPDGWYNAILKHRGSLQFWGVEKDAIDECDWQWMEESEQDVMDNTLRNIFKAHPDDMDYIELDDIVL